MCGYHFSNRHGGFSHLSRRGAFLDSVFWPYINIFLINKESYSWIICCLSRLSLDNIQHGYWRLAIFPTYCHMASNIREVLYTAFSGAVRQRRLKQLSTGPGPFVSVDPSCSDRTASTRQASRGRARVHLCTTRWGRPHGKENSIPRRI
jgi:hypothetical protein